MIPIVKPTFQDSGLRAALLELRPSLLRYLAARRVPADEAEDILQDLFVRAETAVRAPVQEPRAYLYRMLDNLLLNRRRAAGRRAEREHAWVEAQQGALPEADRRPSAEEALIARERLTAVSAALAALPERTRLVFQRYRLEGEPQKQIAADLQISLSAVEKHLQKAYLAVVAARARLDREPASEEGSAR